MFQSARYQLDKVLLGRSLAVTKAKKKPLLKLLFLSLPFFALTQAHALNPNRHISQFGHSTWKTDGASSSVPFAIAQTADGYLWFGTPSGLLRFDGVRFVPRPSEINLLSSKVYSLAGARDGSLWIGTDNGLAHWVHRKLVRYTDSGYVTAIIEDHKGNIWFIQLDISAQAAAFCLVVGQKTRCYGKADGVTMHDGNTLAEDVAGDLWSAERFGVVRWKPGLFATYKLSKLSSEFIVNAVVAVTPTPAGPAWVGIAKAGPGLGLEQLDQGKWKPFVTAEFNSSTLVVTSLLLDREGALWIGTAGQGLYRIRGREVERFQSADGLSSDQVGRIYEDREGNLWVTTMKGFDCFHEISVTTFAGRKGAGLDEADGVLASRDGTVWVARATSLDAIRGDKVVSLGAARGLPGEQVTSLLEDHDGTLWVGIEGALTIYQNGHFHPIWKQSGHPLGLVVGLAEDIEHNIWAAVRGPPRSLVRIRDRQVQEEFPAPEMPAARKVVADPQGGIWLGLLDGNLAHYWNGHLETFSYPHDGPNAYVKQLIVGPDGMVLGATRTGVIAWKNRKQGILNVRNGLPCETVFSQVFDNQGALWLYTECGLIEIAHSELQRWWQEPKAKLQLRIFDASDGVQAGDPPFNGAARTPDGRLWFASSTALQMIDPSHLATNRIAPPVRIEQMVADRKSYSTFEDVRLPPLTRDLEIEYTGLSFVVPEKVRFRYKLEDHDVEWQEPGTRRQAFYTDLRPGKYRFRVLACNNDGVWNEQGATLDFSVAPTWYQTSWFRLSCVAAFILLLWSLYRLRLHQVAAEFNTKVEASVAERTRIARELHDTLLQSFHGLMFRFQAARNMLPQRPGEAMEALDGAITKTEQAIAEGRDAIKDLRNVESSQNDFAEALRAMAQELASSHKGNDGLPVFSVTVEGQPRPLSLIIQDEACRIAHEVLTNAFRHAEAQRIEAEIRYDRHSLRLRFRDDGKGIDQEILKVGGLPGHWGLPGIFERAQRIGAKVDFWSEAGAGTEIQLTVPAAYEQSSAGAKTGFVRSWRSRGQRS